MNWLALATATISKLPLEKFIRKPDERESLEKLKHILEEASPPQTEKALDETPVEEITGQETPTTGASEAPTQYSGTSQLPSHGKACIPCGTGHFQTVAGGLAEALRFGRQDGIEHPEVLDRINASETELNAFERWDGSPERLVSLRPEEKSLMDEMLNSSRHLRHLLSDIQDIKGLEKAAAEAHQMAREYRHRLFQLRIARISAGRNAIA